MDIDTLRDWNQVLTQYQNIADALLERDWKRAERCNEVIGKIVVRNLPR